MSIGNYVMGGVVRGLFRSTSRDRATRQIEEALSHYLELAERVSRERGRVPVTVPPMPGVDADMRAWSFFQILAHNAIVNQMIGAVTVQLAQGESPSGPALWDPKHDVLPPPTVGPDVVEALRRGVRDHLDAVSSLGALRGTAKVPHPLFGAFDAHQWHCMFAFHLKLHVPQARRVVEALEAGGPAPFGS